jgi:hypothetical protein
LSLKAFLVLDSLTQLVVLSFENLNDLAKHDYLLDAAGFVILRLTGGGCGGGFVVVALLHLEHLHLTLTLAH